MLNTRGVVNETPILGIDECLNNETHIGAMATRLVKTGVVLHSEPPWYSYRRTGAGEMILALGNSVTQSAMVPDTGKRIAGASWPDENVVGKFLCNFLAADRLCLLTQNTKKDVDGLWQILENEVRPMLEALTPKRLGLLILAQKPPATLEQYARAVEARLTTRPAVLPGYLWELLP